MIKELIVSTLLFFGVSQLAYPGNTDITWAAPYVFPDGHTETERAEWSSNNGSITAFDDVVIVKLAFDQEAVDLFNSRLGYGLDIDVIQCLEVGSALKTVSIQDTFYGSNSVRDTTFGDSVTSSKRCNSGSGRPVVIGTLLLRDLESINPHQEYNVYYHLNMPIPNEGVKLHLSLQISYDLELVSGPLDEAISSSYGNTFDALDYFVLEGDEFARFVAHPSNGSGTCWSNKLTSANCSVSQFECVAQNKLDFLSIFMSSAYAASCDAGSFAESRDVLIGRIPNPISIGTPPPDQSGAGDEDISIKQFHIQERGIGDFVRELATTLPGGLSTIIEGEGKIENKGNTKIDDADIDYRVDRNNDKFDPNDSQVDEDKEDLDPGETITKHMRNVRIEARLDKTSVNVYANNGDFRETFYADENGIVKLYFFLDVEGEDDHDISTTHSRDEEYGVLTITLVDPPTYNFIWGPMESGATKQGDLWTLRQNITNDTDFASPAFTAQAYSDGDFLKDVTIPSLQPGETKQIELSHHSGAVGQEVKTLCLPLNPPFLMVHPGACGEAGILTINPTPKPPTGSVGYNCDVINGTVSDPNGTKNLEVHIYDQNGHFASPRANTNGHFSLHIANRRTGVHYTYRVYALDDDIGGHTSNPLIRQFSQRCYPSYSVPALRARNYHSDAYLHTTNVAEHNARGPDSNWKKEGPDFLVFDRYVSGTRAIHRSWSHYRQSHLFSHDNREGPNNGYGYDGTAFYCSTWQRPGMVPLYRMRKKYDHSRNKWAHRLAEGATVGGSQNIGFIRGPVMCYVWPL